MSDWRNTKWGDGLANGSAERCLELLRNGADANALDATPVGTPLSWAANAGYTDVAELLLKHGAQVNLASTTGRTALHEASSNGYADLCATLLGACAEPNACDKLGVTPLMVAAMGGRATICRLLIEGGARVSDQNSVGLTALHCAVDGFSPSTCAVLVELGADPLFMPDEARSGYVTPALLAEQRGYSELLALMLSAATDREVAAVMGLAQEVAAPPAPKRTVSMGVL
jgi:ankyrin repeat protein